MDGCGGAQRGRRHRHCGGRRCPRAVSPASLQPAATTTAAWRLSAATAGALRLPGALLLRGGAATGLRLSGGAAGLRLSSGAAGARLRLLRGGTGGPAAARLFLSVLSVSTT